MTSNVNAEKLKQLIGQLPSATKRLQVATALCEESFCYLQELLGTIQATSPQQLESGLKEGSSIRKTWREAIAECSNQENQTLSEETELSVEKTA